MEHILVVEDEKEIRETLRDMLELFGYKVSEAKNAKIGLDTIINKHPDLVLCDVNMPDLDGFELLSAVNQRLKDQIIPPFIFLTARVEMDSVRKGMELGADDYILKPFNHANVLEVIRMRLDKRNKILRSSNGTDKKEESNVTFNKLALPCEEGLLLVPFDDVIKCQADRAYCTFHLKDGRKVLVSNSMKEYESALCENGFLKVHKSTIVNISYAQKYLRGKGGQLLMSDGTIVHVAVRKKEELMRVLKR